MIRHSEKRLVHSCYLLYMHYIDTTRFLDCTWLAKLIGMIRIQDHQIAVYRLLYRMEERAVLNEQAQLPHFDFARPLGRRKVRGDGF